MVKEQGTIYFSKTDPKGKIPTKRDEDAGFDIYACFEDDEIILNPNEIKLIPTGIATAFSADYVLFVKERSSTGSKGLAVRMGVIDSGFRGEIKIGLNNTSNKTIVITKREDVVNPTFENIIYYPYSKAIAQAVLLVIPRIKSIEIPYEDLLRYESERMEGLLGASGK